MSRNLPDTSKSAYKEAQKGLIESHKQRIIEALQSLGIANYESIAAKAKMDKIACMRRLSELERDEVVYKPGSKALTKSGRMSYNYCLTERYTLKVEHPAKQLSDATKEAQEFLNKLQAGELEPKEPEVKTQLNLFGE
jgi:predicted ArsR family transcriptional regulator